MTEGKTVQEPLQRIAFEIQEAGASKWQAMRVLKALEDFSGTEQQLRKKAYDEMAALNPEAAKTLLSFERMRVFTSREKREPFDRGNIIKSLLRETKVPRAVAEKIGAEVEGKIKDLKIEYLNTPLIREMVAIKLLEYGHENIYREYTRIGMPVFEVKKRLESGPFENKEILKEYNWLAKITGQAREMHFDSIIHIFAPEDHCAKMLWKCGFFEGPPEEIAVKAHSNDRICTMPSPLLAINYSIAGMGKPQKKIPYMVASAENIFSLTSTKRGAELALFTGFEWSGLGNLKKRAVYAANSMAATKTKWLNVHFAVDSKYQLKLLGKHLQGDFVVSNNSRERVFLCGDFIGVGEKAKSAIMATGINLDKIALQEGSEKGVYARIREVSKTIKALAAQKEYELSKTAGFDKKTVEPAATIACLSGLLECSRRLSPEAPAKAADEIIIELLEHGFCVSEMPSAFARQFFEAKESIDETQEMLMQMSLRSRRAYGFKYLARSMKEAEALLADAPCVEINLRNEK